jgi:hypothetical protein
MSGKASDDHPKLNPSHLQGGYISSSGTITLAGGPASL